MPYIITTHPQGGRRNPETGSWHDAPRSDDTGIRLSGRSRSLGAPGESRRAVATLEEAQRAAADIANVPQVERVHVPESGGTVGPLPDGTVIEVERTTYTMLAHKADWKGPAAVGQATREIIAAYNAREAS